MRTATTSTTSAPTRLSSWPGGRLPDSGDDLCSQPTISRWENAPTRQEVAAMSYAMIDIYCASYARRPREVTLDIDDTVDVVPGAQRLSMSNTHHGERYFPPSQRS